MAVPCIHDIFCRLAPAAASAASANPYLQSMYAAMAGQASNPYAQLQGTGLISLAQAQNQLISQAATPAQAGTTGNPLLDAYGQYAAQLAAAQQVYTTTANQQQLTASSAIDAQASKFFFAILIQFYIWKNVQLVKAKNYILKILKILDKSDKSLKKLIHKITLQTAILATLMVQIPHPVTKNLVYVTV